MYIDHEGRTVTLTKRLDKMPVIVREKYIFSVFEGNNKVIYYLTTCFV